MSFIDAMQIGWRAIGSNRLRSGLTTLGLVIGVSSVIVLIAVGQGTQKEVTDSIQGLGTDLIFVNPGISQDSTSGTSGGRGSATTLVLSDADAISSANIPDLVDVAGELKISAQAIAGAENQTIDVVGTTEEWKYVRDANMAMGRFLSPVDIENNELSVVLGSSVAEALFSQNDPIGESLRISIAGGRVSFNFQVIGVMSPRSGNEGLELNDQVYIPVTALQSRLRRFLRNADGEIIINQIVLQTSPDADKAIVKQLISEVLIYKHQVTEPDFTIQSQDDLISAATEVSNTLSLLLGSVAGISLLVGGIGVMNIMLVSVTERTREIGIRRAVGAQSKDIVKQFVTEALMLSVFGGLAGVAIGVGISILLDGREIAGQTMTTVIQEWSIFLAFAVSASVGLVSGIYPAYKATFVDPIAALRNE